MSTATQLEEQREKSRHSFGWLSSWWAALWEHRVAYLFMAPFMLVFTVFILIPVILAVLLMFFQFDAISWPEFVGWRNVLEIMTQDRVFIEHALPNTFKFALIVGPVGFALSFILAWLIAELPRGLRDGFTLAIYAPSISQGVAMTVVWLAIFSGDRLGYLNNILITLGFIHEPVLWLQEPTHFMTVMIVIALWGAMGLGFLAILAGLVNVNPTLYEAGAIDGISNRLQEIWYLTIPAIKGQMLFAAVMAVVGTLQAGAIGQMMSRYYGQAITPQYSGHLLTNHMNDFASIRMEFGYSAAISVIILLIVFGTSKVAWMFFGEDE